MWVYAVMVLNYTYPITSTPALKEKFHLVVQVGSGEDTLEESEEKQCRSLCGPLLGICGQCHVTAWPAGLFISCGAPWSFWAMSIPCGDSA